MHASFSQQVKNVSYVTNENSEPCEMVTLDDFFSMKDLDLLDFIKIDTEGHELEVLEGAMNILNNLKPKFIQIEFNWHQLFKKVTIYNFSTILKNYRLFQLLPEGWVERSPKDPLANIFCFSNYVFVKS